MPFLDGITRVFFITMVYGQIEHKRRFKDWVLICSLLGSLFELIVSSSVEEGTL